MLLQKYDNGNIGHCFESNPEGEQTQSVEEFVSGISTGENTETLGHLALSVGFFKHTCVVITPIANEVNKSR